MDFLRKIIEKINSNAILRNAILAVCAIILFAFVVTILLNLFTRHNSYHAVPDLSGLTTRQADDASKKARLRIEVNDSIFMPMYPGGVILDQSPKPGSKVKAGRRVFVTLNSFRQKMVRIPYVTGYSLRQAKNNLEVAGLEIEKLVYRPDIATNNVLEEYFGNQLITADSKLEAEQGSGIRLVVGVSGDERNPVVPKLVGYPLRQAKSRLWEAGLNVGELIFDDEMNIIERGNALVYTQTPEYGMRVPFGASVQLRMTLDSEKAGQGVQASERASRRAIEAQVEEEARRLHDRAIFDSISSFEPL